LFFLQLRTLLLKNERWVKKALFLRSQFCLKKEEIPFEIFSFLFNSDVKMFSQQHHWFRLKVVFLESEFRRLSDAWHENFWARVSKKTNRQMDKWTNRHTVKWTNEQTEYFEKLINLPSYKWTLQQHILSDKQTKSYFIISNNNVTRNTHTNRQRRNS